MLGFLSNLFWIYILEKLGALMEVALYGILRRGVL